MPADTILVIATGWDGDEWMDAIRANAPERKAILGPDVPNPEDIAYALVWKPPAGLLNRLPNLKLIHSLGAGVDHLMNQGDLPDVPILRVVSDAMTRRMVEWVVLQVLLHFRRQPLYDAQKLQAIWKPRRQPAAPDVRVGIMGMGVLGRAALGGLAPFQFDIAGWSRSPHPDATIPMFTGREELGDFLARTDILISLLPLTPDTRGILSMPLFERLPQDGALGGPILINAGRGGLQVEADIDAALRTGILSAASVDVFEVEPLPADNPLWATPNLIITPHNSAPSAPFELVPGIIAALKDFEAGRPLKTLVDRTAAY